MFRQELFPDLRFIMDLTITPKSLLLEIPHSCTKASICKRFDGVLTHGGRMMHIWVGELTIIVSDNGLSPGRRQAII